MNSTSPADLIALCFYFHGLMHSCYYLVLMVYIVLIVHEILTLVGAPRISHDLDFLAHLAYMPMGLCNHDLYIMCHCHHCWGHHLCTAVPVTVLLIETSNLTDTYIYIYIPSICIWNIESISHIFLK